MEELTIEEKAARYDEAIELIRKCETDKYGCVIGIKPSDIFHELKESEDEKLREQVVYAINQLHACECTKNKLIAWLEKQGEQKSVAKIEPKFKVGDWIIHNKNIELSNSLMLVTGKDNNEYLCKDIDGQCSYNIKFIDKDYHLWTIQDAKVGDVLADETDIVIFKDNNYDTKDKSGCMSVYCSYNCWREFGGINPIYYKPATKEQRDLLFQKMKEAGYEWDADKKEPVKIEQKSVWSEEDEEMTSFLNAICIDVQNPNNCASYSTYYNEVEKAKDWLKSIKDRVLQKVELTQLDKNILEAAIAFVEQNNHFNCWRGVDKHTVLSALHSLRPQNTWKPSDEQIQALEFIVHFHTFATKDTREEMEALLNDIKKLREE